MSCPAPAYRRPSALPMPQSKKRSPNTSPAAILNAAILEALLPPSKKWSSSNLPCRNLKSGALWLSCRNLQLVIELPSCGNRARGQRGVKGARHLRPLRSIARLGVCGVSVWQSALIKRQRSLGCDMVCGQYSRRGTQLRCAAPGMPLWLPPSNGVTKSWAVVARANC